MTRSFLTQADQDFVRANAGKIASREMAAIRGVRQGAIKVWASRNNVSLKLADPALARKPVRWPRVPDSLAERIAALLGEIPMPPAPRMEIPDADLLRYTGRADVPQATLDALRAPLERFVLDWPATEVPDTDEGEAALLRRVAGLDAFCREVCHLELDTPQLSMVFAVLGAKRSIILASRRSGKSHALGAIATWTAVCTPNSQVVVVGAADRQAKEISERVVMPLFAQDDRLFASIRASNKEVMELKNGSLVRFYPATGQIRGVGASLLLVDEGRDIQNEELVYSSIEPMLANSNGSMAIFSTPWMASGKLWDCWHSPFYAKVKSPASASRFVTVAYLESQRLLMSHQVFGAEFDAEFMSSVSGYFSSESITKCLRDYALAEAATPGRTYGGGLDFGRYRDASVFLVASRGEDNRYRVDWLRAFVDVPLSEQRPYARYLDDIFHFHRVTAESAGLGIQIAEEIASDLPGRVELFKPSINEKARAFENLKGVVERNEVDIPH